MRKVLIIRFSSFGDVLQCLSVVGRIKQSWPDAEIHWVTRADYTELIRNHPAVSKVWALERDMGLAGLRRLTRDLRAANFSHVYDAHNSLRSRLIGWRLKGFLAWRIWFGQVRFLRRPIYRLRRFVLFRLRKNLFPQPFNGQADLLRPLQHWGIPLEAPAVPQLFLSQEAHRVAADQLGDWRGQPFVALVPSAAYPLKRWPIAHWRRLIATLASLRFVVLGGPEDGFLNDLVGVAPDRVRVVAGKLSLAESAAVVRAARAVVANDTGLLHVAEQLGVPCVALMGPAPFGFPSRPLTKILELELACRPCSKHGQGPCVNAEYQKCLVGISPEQVATALRTQLEALP